MTGITTKTWTCARLRAILTNYAMRAIRLNHVSISAIDLDESARFYTAMFGLEPIPTYTFSFPVQYLRLGDVQLHLFERLTEAPSFHHVAIEVDDFEAIYKRAQELALLDNSSFSSSLCELPDGSVQMYMRDPAGNLIEIDWPDARDLDPAVVGEIPKLVDRVPQADEGRIASLFLDRRSSVTAREERR